MISSLDTSGWMARRKLSPTEKSLVLIILLVISLRFAIETFNMAEAELSSRAHSPESEKLLTSPTYPPSPPPAFIDPIIFQFGRKRPGHDIRDSDGVTAEKTHKRLFSPKRLRLDSDSSEFTATSLLHNVFCGSARPLTDSILQFHPDSHTDVSKTCPQSPKRVPLNRTFSNASFSTPLMPELTYQWLTTAFWGQMMASYNWTPPKDEPLDLSCKESNFRLPASKNFSSISWLVGSQEGIDADIRRCSAFPQTFPKPIEDSLFPQNLTLESAGLLPTFETLVNSMKLFNDLKFNYLNSVNRNFFCDKSVS